MVSRSMRKYLFGGLVTIGILMASCISEKDEHAPEISAVIGYGVNLDKDFKSPVTKSGGDGFAVAQKEIKIEQLNQKFGEKNLYLHTITEDWRGNIGSAVNVGAKDCDGKNIDTKGTIITNGGEFTLDDKEIAVSAWVYNGDKEDGYASGQQYFVNDVLTSPWKSNRYWPMPNDNMLFYGYAPTDVQNGEKDNNGVANYVTLPSGWSNGIPSFDYVVPQEITEQSDLLVASAYVANNDFGQPVNLTFYHALTAVQIKVEDLQGLLIKSVSISGLKDEETYTYAHNYDYNAGSDQNLEDGFWSESDVTETGEYTLDFTSGDLEKKDGVEGNDGFLFSKDDESSTVYTLNEGNFVMFLMPQKLGDEAKITLTGYDTVREEEVTLWAKIGGSDKEWEKGKLVVYKISISDIFVEYVFDVDEITTVPEYLVKDLENDSISVVDGIVKYVPFYGQVGRQFAVKSYKKITKLGVKEPEIVPLEWYIDESENNYKIPDWIDRITVKSGVGTSDEVSFETVEYDVVAQSPVSTSHDNLTKDGFKYLNDTKSRAYDLSTKGGTEVRNTANCYIVDAPGYYKLPLVYGNAIMAGNVNPNSYTSNTAVTGGIESATSTATLQGAVSSGTEVSVNYKVMTQFFNYGGYPITDPYIKNDTWVTDDISYLQGEVVWQDEPCVVTEPSVIEENGEWYLCFRVREDCICECNAVVAIKDNTDGTDDVYGTGNILWSWHIWVTDNNLTDISLTNEENFGSSYASVYPKFTLMNVPLGYCDAETKTYNSRSTTVKFCQVENDNLIVSEEFVINQVGENGYSVEVLCPENVVYYQFGRKDPIIPGFMIANATEQNKSYYTERRARYSLGYGGGRVGFHQLSKEETLSLSDGIRLPGQMFQTPQFFLPDSTKNNSLLKVGMWYGKGTYFTSTTDTDPIDVYVNLWNNNNSLLPMFTYNKSAVSSDIYSNLYDLLGRGVWKTIYDPSPAGYEVPNTDAFGAFTEGGLNYEDNVNTAETNEILFNSVYNPTAFSTAYGYAGYNFVDNNSKSFRIGAFGYRDDETGKLWQYGNYGGALTANLLCIQGSVNDVNLNYLKPYFGIGSSRVYYKLFDGMVFWPISISSLAKAFPVIPAKTWQNRY